MPLATSGYLTVEDSAALVQEALREVEQVRKSNPKGKLENSSLDRLDLAEDKLNNSSDEANLQRFANMTPSEAVCLPEGIWSSGNFLILTGLCKRLD